MSAGAPSVAPAGTGALDRLERTLHRWDTALCVATAGLLTLVLVAWTLLRGLAHAGTPGGLLLKLALGGALGAALAWRFLKKLGAPGAIAFGVGGAGLFGIVLRDLGHGWFSNLQGWLQDGSALLLFGGPRGVATRLTLLLVLVGGSLATATGRHISIDLLTRLLGPKARKVLSPISGLAAALVCFLSAWGFFDYVAIDAFGAPKQGTVSEKLSTLSDSAGRHFFLFRQQVALDLRVLPRVLGGDPWDRAITGAEFNEVVKGPAWAEYYGAERAAALVDPAPEGKRSPLISVPQESPRGLLAKDLGMIIPPGLLLIGLRFLLWVLRRCPREEETAGDQGGSLKQQLAGWGTLAAVGLLAFAGGGLKAAALGVGALLGIPLFAVMAGGTALAWAAQSEPLNRLAPKVLEESFAGSPVLVTIPLFTLLGFVLARSRAPDRIIAFARASLGWLPGGLALVCLGTSAFFTTLTGASGVTIVAIGGLLLPALEHEGYPRRHVLGLVTAGGSLGLLFPPSLPILVYALVSGLDFGLAFQAAFLPGMVVLTALAAFAIFTAWRAKVPRTAFTAGPVFSTAKDLSWETGLPVILLFGVLSGLAGIDESAALGLAWVGWVAFRVHKDLKREQLREIVGEATALAGAVVLILMMANALMNWVIDQQLPGKVLEALMGAGLKERWHLLLVINVFLLVVGMVMDGFSAILVTVPLVVPLAARFGFDPFHLAVMFLLNLELAFLMPPLGLNLFISAFRFQRPLGEVYRATLPFVGVVGATLLLVIAVPWLSNVAVQPAIARARAEAERLGVPPANAWALECVQEDTTHPRPCTEEEKKKYAAPADEGEDDELMKQMMEGG